MKVTQWILAGAFISTAVCPAQAASVAIPGADSSLPSTAYLQNLTDTNILRQAQQKNETYRRDSQSPKQSEEDLDALALENLKAINFHSTLFILTDTDRSITFTVPKNSIRGLVMPKSKGFAQYADTHNGSIGVEITPIGNSETWETSGKHYKDITKKDIKDAFTKHNPSPEDKFIDGGKFTYEGLSEATWDVATMKTQKGTDTISTINFSLTEQPEYMYHIGIINTTPHADYRKDLSLLANYTVPSIKTNAVPAAQIKKIDMGPFTVSVLHDLTEAKNTFNPETGGIKKYNGEYISHIIMEQPVPKGMSEEDIFFYALRKMITLPVFNPKNDNRYYAVWHNGRPGFITAFNTKDEKPSMLTYITHDGKSMLVSSIIYDPEHMPLSQDELLSLITDVHIHSDSENYGVAHIMREVAL